MRYRAGITRKEEWKMLRSMRETIRLNKRAIGIWWRESPGMLVSLFFYVVTGALLPYAGIYFSARIITELSGAKNPVILRNLVVLLLGMESVAGLLYHYFKNCYTVERNDMTANLTQILSEKMLSLDFAKVDDSVVQDQILQIEQINRWSRLGLCMVVFTMERMLQAIAGIAGALILTVSFFRAKAVKEAFLWMNSPLFTIVFLAGILGFTALASWVEERVQNMAAELSERATFGNRLWSFMARMAGEREREQDIRVYEQIPAVMGFYEKNKVWGIGTGMDRLEKGKGGILSAVAKMTERFCSGLVYLLVCLKAYGGAFGIGAVTQYISAVTALSHNLEELLGALGEVHTNREFLKKTLDFLDTPNDMYQGSLTVEKRNDCQYEVEFRDVSFCYPGTDRKVLDHVNLKFRIGEKLAIVGENGSGKSTFIKLLCRLYDPTEGEILLNGINIKKYNYKEYMSVFSVVFQDFKLFALPLGQNVAASTEYDADKVQECLKLAGFDARSARMEKGLDTWLYKDCDADGVSISGGEEQKIALARALYQNAAFLILDEPTAALDPIAEAEVYSSFNEIVGNRTAVYISHRLSSCRFCDEIVVFDRGRIVQQGTHEELVEQTNCKYYELWSAQAKYYA